MASLGCNGYPLIAALLHHAAKLLHRQTAYTTKRARVGVVMLEANTRITFTRKLGEYLQFIRKRIVRPLHRGDEVHVWRPLVWPYEHVQLPAVEALHTGKIPIGYLHDSRPGRPVRLLTAAHTATPGLYHDRQAIDAGAV